MGRSRGMAEGNLALWRVSRGGVRRGLSHGCTLTPRRSAGARMLFPVVVVFFISICGIGVEGFYVPRGPEHRLRPSDPAGTSWGSNRRTGGGSGVSRPVIGDGSLTVRQGATLTAPRPFKMQKVKAPSMDGTREDLKLGVLMLQLGGPENMDDVEGFLYNLFADPDIIRLPGIVSALQKPLAYVISKRRAPKSRAAYESIGGGSPIVRYTREQAAGVEHLLQEMGLDAKCYVAMRYWKPFTDTALAEMKRDGVNTMVVVPLYPQFSISTSGSSLRVLQDLFFEDAASWSTVRHTVIPAWYDRPGYVQAMGRLIQKELDKFSAEERTLGPLHVLFSAHGVPQRYIQMGDPYQEQIERCVELISKEYSSDVVTHLSYQSRVGPIEWLRPYTDDKLEELGETGVKNLVVVPISFVSEHIETLEEIDMEYRELAEEKGIVNWRRVPALNTDPGFIEVLADMVIDALTEPTITVTEACALNNLDIVPVYNEQQGRFAILGIMTSVLLDLLYGRGFLHLLGH